VILSTAGCVSPIASATCLADVPLFTAALTAASRSACALRTASCALTAAASFAWSPTFASNALGFAELLEAA